MSFISKIFSKKEKKDLDKGLEKTKTSLFGKISKAIVGKSTVDEEFLDELEGIMIGADVGLDTTVKIIERLESRIAEHKYINTADLNDHLEQVILELLSENKTEDVEDFTIPPGHTPHIILVVGVNGVGKTTSIGKLAHQYKLKEKSIVLGAADTFRAAAVDQLKIWADRVGCHFYSKGMNTDPAAVAFETVKYAVDHKIDLAIIDTAGRLHTKQHLMKELSKIKASINKALPGAPHEVIIVLDASTGQNAMEQCKKFSEATDVTAMVLTKLDGTAKGGIVIGLSDQYQIPIKYIGVGEGIEHMQVFNRKAFVQSLFS